MREKNMQFAFINIFLKIANHPALLLSDPSTSPVSYEYIQKNLPEILDDNLKEDFIDPQNCGKLKVKMRKISIVICKRL